MHLAEAVGEKGTGEPTEEILDDGDAGFVARTRRSGAGDVCKDRPCKNECILIEQRATDPGTVDSR
jgi:hypothetical protein